MNKARGPRLVLASALALVLPALILSAATYLPMSDAELVARAPIVARATVTGIAVEAESISGEDRPFTVVTLSLVEAIKGSPGETFAVRLPGGVIGDRAWVVPGTPHFSAGENVILMLAPHPAHPGQLRLTELGLSKFVVVTDDAGKRFAVRPAFSDTEDLFVSKRAAQPGVPAGARDADSFLSFLRAAARGALTGDVTYAAPVRAAAKWVNIGGREPGGGCQDNNGNDIACLFRWNFGNVQPSSPDATLSVTGTQTNLFNDEPKCGTDANCDVQNAATAWHGVPSSDVHISGPTTPGNITVNLDATSSQDGGTAWNTALGCPPSGVIGLGGPNHGNGPTTYRNDPNFYAIQDGTVSMRKVTCTSPSYSAATFRSAVLHEVGHVLGLGHPDDNGATPPAAVESIHSTTSSNAWSNAVMHSVISPAKPDTPQTDDIQAIQYLYGTAAVGAVPVADFSFAPAAPTADVAVAFHDASTGGPTGWNWDFGDPASGTLNTSMLQNPSHTYGTPGNYTVTLTAGSLNGSSAVAASKSFTVAGGQPGVCHVDPSTLCLNGGRFKTTITWEKPDTTSGPGTGVGLTTDSGYFWFFSNTNIEAVVKVLNACGLNGHYWVFAAGLTNVKATLTIVDEQTGVSKPYVNPQGNAFAPIQDTTAFSTCP
jgi:PKD repeat protein